MTTLGDIVVRARRMLRGARREVHNRLESELTSGDVTLHLSRMVAPITVNSYIAVGAELMYVVGTDATANSVTVERGADGTIPATHAAGSTVEVNWRWFTADLAIFLADEVRSWPDTIYAVDRVDVSLGIDQRAVDLPLTRYRMPLSVRRRSHDPVTIRTNWVDVPVRQRRIEVGLPTTDFPSGNALVVVANPYPSQWRIEYAQELNLAGLEDLATNTTSLPLSDRLIDAAVYGIAWRALAGDEAGRSSTASQPEPREAEEVEAFDRMRSASSYKALRDQRLEEEKRRLRQLYPVKFS